MEKWDIYNSKRQKIGKQVFRGDKLKDNEFHLVVNAWIVNDKKQFLITQRSLNKSFQLMWECTGGSALAGESGLEACVREIKEELGFSIDKNSAKKIGTALRYFDGCPDILEVYIFNSNIELKDIKIQKEEVNDVMWASKEEVLKLYKEKKFEASLFFMDALCYFD